MGEDVFARNQAWVKPGAHTYNTPLNRMDETAFRFWMGANKVPFDPKAPVSDYDMRGFWNAMQSGDPRAASAVNPNDNRMHYPDVWKTPYHQTFSRDSQWATPNAPQWTGDDKLIDNNGNVIFDERASPPPAGSGAGPSGDAGMNPNMAHFARMAAPQMQGRAMPSAPPQGYSAPSMPVRPPMNPASRMAAQGRGGDSMMAHVTPGEIAVPPQVQTPEVLAALNKAFAAAGANPTSFQAGNPDQKVNPETGVPEFSFFDTLLPIGLGIAGSAIGGPVLGMGLADLGVGATTAGILGGALGGGLGSTAGNLIQGKPFGQAAAMGAGSAIGSGIGGAVAGGASSVSDLFNNFGGAAPAAQAAQVGPGAGQALDLSDISKNVAAANAASPDVMDRLMSLFGGGSPGSLKRIAGSALGGAIGSGLAESAFSPPQLKPNLGPPLPPLSQTPGLSNYIGGGSSSLTGPIRQGSPLFPRPGYRPGIDPQFNYFSG